MSEVIRLGPGDMEPWPTVEAAVAFQSCRHCRRYCPTQQYNAFIEEISRAARVWRQPDLFSEERYSLVITGAPECPYMEEE